MEVNLFFFYQVQDIKMASHLLNSMNSFSWKQDRYDDEVYCPCCRDSSRTRVGCILSLEINHDPTFFYSKQAGLLK